MPVTPYVFDGGPLSAAAAPQGTPVPTLTKRVIKAAAVVNPTAAPIALSVYLVPPGGAADVNSLIISARAIAPGETYVCPELVNQGLNVGGAVHAAGDGLILKYTAVDFV